MASGFKTGGRQKGTPNKKTAEKLAAIIDAGITPLEYMLKILRDETTSLERRDEMAKAAAPSLIKRQNIYRLAPGPDCIPGGVSPRGFEAGVFAAGIGEVVVAGTAVELFTR